MPSHTTAGDTTANQGGGGAGASATGFYLSTNSSLDATDVLLGSRTVVALTAGTADTGTVALTIPTSTGTGSFYLIAKADGGGAVPETAETNNTRARLLKLGPDLVIASLTVQGFWMAPLGYNSHPFTRHSTASAVAGSFSQTHVGDDTDTSPYPDPALRGISTAAYIRNMSVLIKALER